MKIRIFGTGCPKCKELYVNVQSAVATVGIQADIEKVTDMEKIISAGIMLTPALEIDGEIVSSGKLLTTNEIVSLFSQTNHSNSCKCSCNCSQKEELHDPNGQTASCCCSKQHSPGKKLLTYLLLTFVGVAIAVMLVRENKPNNITQETTTTESTLPSLTIYYFHGNVRCTTCNKFEKLLKEVVETQFGDSMKNGILKLKIINIDEVSNTHYVQDYGLTAKSIVLEDNHSHRKLDDIWAMIRRGDNDFKSYIANNIREMMETSE